MQVNNAYPLLSVTGIEIEYMLVDQNSLEITPIADKVLAALSQNNVVENEVEFDNIAVSNELALHVIEIKSLRPVDKLPLLEAELRDVQNRLQLILSQQFNAKMLPTGAHPWLIPDDKIALWPHGSREIYHAFDRIFNCAGHGWVNLQSTHINLPFSNDQEFAQLHNAIRLLLPIIPALTASTPFIEGEITGYCDSRLLFYGANQQQIPIISGHIVPEFINDSGHYHDSILAPMYAAIAPYDPDGVLQAEWLNSRGAIARFDRSAIEIRIMDTQESLRQDIACVSAIVSALHYLVKQTDYYYKRPMDQGQLCQIYQDSICDGLSDVRLPQEYLQQFGFSEALTRRQLWRKLLAISCAPLSKDYQHAVEKIITEGNLAQRMLAYYHENPSLPKLYQQLAHHTQTNGYFHAGK